MPACDYFSIDHVHIEVDPPLHSKGTCSFDIYTIFLQILETHVAVREEGSSDLLYSHYACTAT